MKKLIFLFFFSAISFGVFPLMAQKIMRYDFQYESDSSSWDSMKMLTEVSAPSSNFLRLFFKGTQLGNNSYLLLEATDGAKQKLSEEDLKNWNYSSAYFNGNSVKVSLYTATGENNKIFVNEIKANEGNAENKNVLDHAARKAAPNQSTNSTNSLPNLDEIPYAAAVGRFTDGQTSDRTGWIAANGVIISSIDTKRELESSNLDIIEFNVPPSNPDGSVNHPWPEDQYPINFGSFVAEIIEGKKYIYSYLYDQILIKKFQGRKKNHSTAGYLYLEALPNCTGKRPGERQQEYFQVTKHPSGPSMEGSAIDIFHNAVNTEDGVKNKTLQLNIAETENPRRVLTHVDDKDRFLVYNFGTQRDGIWNQNWAMSGAPITYHGSNVAVGIHNIGFGDSPSLGTGFRYDNMRNLLSDYFSSTMTYVDQESYWDESNGEIDKPYHQIKDGVANAPDNAVVSVARGSYNETMYINKAVTLRAPVGTVVIGKSEVGARYRKAELPKSYFMEDDDDFEATDEAIRDVHGFKSYPNPFNDFTEVHYSLTETTNVDVKVFDILGNEVSNIVQESQAPGFHSVIWDGNSSKGRKALPGLYIIRLQAGAQSSTVKVIKNE